jgi:hypothetical protein
MYCVKPAHLDAFVALDARISIDECCFSALEILTFFHGGF